MTNIKLDRKTILSWFERKLNIKVKELSLSLSMSTAMGLNDLAEDEIIPTPIPMEIELENIKVHLIEDRPPVNITSPGSLPVDLKIGRMFITRDSEGVFQIQPKDEVVSQHIAMQSDKDKEVFSMQIVMQQLKIDNENLRKQLSAVEKKNDKER